MSANRRPDQLFGQADVTVGHRQQPDTPRDPSGYPCGQVVSGLVEPVGVRISAVALSESRSSPVVVQHPSTEFPNLVQPTELRLFGAGTAPAELVAPQRLGECHALGQVFAERIERSRAGLHQREEANRRVRDHPPQEVGVELRVADIELDVRGCERHARQDVATQEADAVFHEPRPILHR